MKLSTIVFAIFMLQVFAGCNNETENEGATLPETAPASVAVTAPDTATIKPPATTVAPVAVTAKAALNPAHGQPGHRCDIAVGAPLDSKPNQPAINATPTQPVTVAPAPVQPTVAVGVNPAHGQPNHRCDIAVGAPLNSKPIQPNINAAPQAAIAPVSAPPPPPLVNLRPGEAVQAGKNPAHGQPGHRCDIAVGAPLNSKPPQ